MLGYDSLQFQKNNITHITGQKLPPSGKGYIYFKLTGKLPTNHSVTNNGHQVN